MTPNTQMRLDAAESIFFKRQLESIDARLYSTIYPALKSRTLIPSQEGIPDWAREYTWRMTDKFGKAKFIGNKAHDLPRANVSGTELVKSIKPLGASYGYDIFEIKAAMGRGLPLDTYLADAARFMIDNLMDETLATGDADLGLEGLLNLTGVDDTFAPTDKGGGATEWSTATATPAMIAADVTGLISFIQGRLKGAGDPMFNRYTVVVPIEQYNILAQRQMSVASDVTILKWLLQNSPYIESIEPWHRCDGAAGGGDDRMVAYPKTPLVLSAIVPMEFTTMPVEQRNLEYVVNCVATTGGVVCRYPVAMAYEDAI